MFLVGIGDSPTPYPESECAPRNETGRPIGPLERVLERIFIISY
jgi:hypothetical protein